MDPVQLRKLALETNWNPSRGWVEDPPLGANRVGIALMELRSEFEIEAKFAKDRETAAEEVLEIQDHVASAAAASAAAADECSPEMVDVSSAAFQKADDDEAKEEEQEEPVGSPLL
jgi:hypothetical protein